MLKQTRLMSLVESLCNTGSGFIVAYSAWLWVLPSLFGIETRPGRGFLVTVFFTVLSIARGYIWRRWFVRREGREDAAQKEG